MRLKNKRIMDNRTVRQAKSSQDKEVWVIIPAFNEEASIDKVLDDFSDKEYSVLVVDDSSQDNTIDVALNYPITLLKHIINLGQGAALQTGFDYVINHTKAAFIVTFDSDGQHDVNDIPQLLEPLKNGKADVALGSRFLNSKRPDGIPLLKLVTLRFGVLFTRITSKQKLTDTHNGLRGFTTKSLQKIQITHDRMAHASEIIIQIAKHNLRWIEIPVTIRYTPYSKKKGQSILNSLNILWDLLVGRN